MAAKKVENKEEGQLRDYELVFIVSPEVAEENFEATMDSVGRIITGKRGVISDIEQWGKRRLAYPIKHFDEGSYVLARLKLPPGQNKELEENLKISEDILRHLLISVP